MCTEPDAATYAGDYASQAPGDGALVRRSRRVRAAASRADVVASSEVRSPCRSCLCRSLSHARSVASTRMQLHRSEF